MGGVACEGVYVGVYWEIVQGVFSAKGPGLGCKYQTHPVLGLKLGSPIGGLWRESHFFFQLLCWNPHSQCDGELGPGEGGLESPQEAAHGWEEGSPCSRPKGTRTRGRRGELRAAVSSPLPMFLPPGQAGAEGRCAGPPASTESQGPRGGGGERGSWPPTDTVNFGLKQ